MDNTLDSTNCKYVYTMLESVTQDQQVKFDSGKREKEPNTPDNVSITIKVNLSLFHI